MRKVLFLLAELRDSDLQWLAGAGRSRRVAPGDVLVREGEALGSLFIVIEGELRVTVAARGGGEVARLGAGEVVGELSLLDGRKPNATVAAATESLVFAVPRDSLQERIRIDEGFSARFHRALCLFLAHRLRRAVTMSGDGAEASLDEDEFEDDELPPDLMDAVSLAGARFTWFADRVRGA